MKNHRNSLWSAVLGFAVVGLPLDALAYDLQLCAEIASTYADNGYGEDYWPTDVAHGANGIRIRVRRYNSCDFSGASGYTEYVPWTYAASNGCSPVFTSAYADACYQVAVASWGKPAGSAANNVVYGYNASGSTEAWYVNNVDPPNQSGSSTWQFPNLDSFRMYQTVAWNIDAGFRGLLAGTTVNVYPIDDSAVCGCGSGSDVGSRWCKTGTTTGNICVDDDDGDIDRKFFVSHEYGHHNLRFTAGIWSSGSNCASHGMTSQEEQACAMIEGWGNFVSAVAWNVHGADADGKMRYWGSCEGNSTIDVESSGDATDCVVKYMETNFGAGTWPGNGGELDWMRTWWDYYTNEGGWPGSRPTQSQMQLEFEGYLPVSGFPKRAYDDYRKGVADQSGCTQYERIVALAAANGADHCEDEGSGDWCDNVPGCTDVD